MASQYEPQVNFGTFVPKSVLLPVGTKVPTAVLGAKEAVRARLSGRAGPGFWSWPEEVVEPGAMSPDIFLRR